MIVNTRFPEFYFLFESSAFQIGNKIVICFPWHHTFMLLISKKMSSKYLSLKTTVIAIGLSRWLRGKEPTCQCKRHRGRGLDPWVRKIPWRRKWQPTPVFLPGESLGRGSQNQIRLKQLLMHWRRQENCPLCTKGTFTCQSLEPVIITFFKQKMWISWGSLGRGAHPGLSGEREGEMREKRRRHRDTKRRRQSEDGGRVWSDAATSQGISRHQSRHVTRSYKK